METQKGGPDLATMIGSPIAHIKISATKLRANGQDHTTRNQGPPPCAKLRGANFQSRSMPQFRFDHSKATLDTKWSIASEYLNDPSIGYQGNKKGKPDASNRQIS